MSLSDKQIDQLKDAFLRYTFPCWVWDKGPRDLHIMPEVEKYIRSRLQSDDEREMKEGLASVVCWGWGRTARQVFRAKTVEGEIRMAHLLDFVSYRRQYANGDMLAFSRLRIPELGQMAFGSKVLAFMHPRKRAVLDSKIACVLNGASLGTGYWDILKKGAEKRHIPVTERSAELYDKWCRCCIEGARRMGNSYRAVDFERAIFRLHDENDRETAIDCIDSIKVILP